MAQLSPEQQAAVDAQKAQCPFCQIVADKIPAKKVYEDDKVVAILDIRPAVKGHILLMPKEHYPIMPLIPPETFKHMFGKAKEIARCVKEAMLCPRASIFIANGAAAGQQSSHFLMHILPRENGDGLDMLSVPEKPLSDTDRADIMTKVGPQLKALLGRNLAILGYKEGSKAAKMPDKITKDEILKLIEQNPPLKKMIIDDPEGFKKMVPTHPQLSQLFKDADIEDIISNLTGGKKKDTHEKKKETSKHEDNKSEDAGSEKIDLDKIASMFK